MHGACHHKLCSHRFESLQTASADEFDKGKRVTNLFCFNFEGVTGKSPSEEDSIKDIERRGASTLPNEFCARKDADKRVTTLAAFQTRMAGLELPPGDSESSNEAPWKSEMNNPEDLSTLEDTFEIGNWNRQGVGAQVSSHSTQAGFWDSFLSPIGEAAPPIGLVAQPKRVKRLSRHCHFNLGFHIH